MPPKSPSPSVRTPARVQAPAVGPDAADEPIDDDAPDAGTPAVPAEGGVADHSLAERAHRALMGKILNGELAPNEVVTERQIALQLGISRTPLREAIRRLEGARLLERQRSGALVVRSLPVEEYIGILDVRRVLEAEAARLAAGHLDPADLARLRGRVDAVLALPESEPLPPAAEDEDLHLLVARSAGNPVLEEMILALRTRTSMFRFGRLPTRRREVMREHLAIVDALASGDADAARSAMEAHIDNVRTTLIARLSGTHRAR